MSIGLPELLYADGIGKPEQVEFGGLNRNADARDGEIYDMKNMSSDRYPLLSPRMQRYRVMQTGTAFGFYARDGVLWVSDNLLFWSKHSMTESVGQVEQSYKRFASIGSKVIILPDKVVFDTTTLELTPIEATWTGAAQMTDGTYAGAAAKANTIYAEGADWAKLFRVGDAVTISGCINRPENNKTPIIREIDGDYLRFYENCFTIIGESADEDGIMIRRAMPDLDYICEHENRLWGCKGDTVYASKLGDPFNWNVFDGLSTDSFAVDVGTPGDFTGCFSYREYACFFKEDYIYKVYGNTPSNFELIGGTGMGVAQGCAESLAVAGDTLFYLSRVGVMGYTGGIPQSVAAPFGMERFTEGVAASDGMKYYISMSDITGTKRLYVLDTRYGTWHIEDKLVLVGGGWSDGFWLLDGGGRMWLGGDTRLIDASTLPETADYEDEVESMVEFADFVNDSPNKKHIAKIQLRLELEAGSELTVKIRFDSGGEWQTVKVLTAERKRSFYLPIIPRRCDHLRLRLEGKGHWVLHSLVRECAEGSEL